MPLSNYADLENLDVAGIRRLLDPNFDRSEVNRIAAERSLGGGGFSGARQNRLLESEIANRLQIGHSMLTPYLQMEQQRNSQTQSEAAQAARQLEQNNSEMQRLQLSLQNADARQAAQIAAQMRELQAQNAAAMERLQLSEQGATSRQAIGEQGANTRQATGIEAELRLARERAGIRGPQTGWNDTPGLTISSGGGPTRPSAPISTGGTQPSGPNSATMDQVYRLTSGWGGTPTPNLKSGGTIGTGMLGQQWFTGTGGAPTNPGPMQPSYGIGNYNSEGGGVPMVNNNNSLGNFESEPQPIWQVGSAPGEIDWTGVDTQINSPNNWVDYSANSFDPSLYA